MHVDIKPRTIILYGQRRHVFIGVEQQTDSASCGQVSKFVVEQVGDDAMKKCCVG